MNGDGKISFDEFEAYVQQPGNENLLGLFTENFLETSNRMAHQQKWLSPEEKTAAKEAKKTN